MRNVERSSAISLRDYDEMALWLQHSTDFAEVFFGTREELTTPARQKLTTNRPRVRCLSDEHGLVALGLAARLKKFGP